MKLIVEEDVIIYFKGDIYIRKVGDRRIDINKHQFVVNSESYTYTDKIFNELIDAIENNKTVDISSHVKTYNKFLK